MAKFHEGAWITVIAIPAVIALLMGIRGYYDELARNVRDPRPLQLEDTRPPSVLVATENWSKLTRLAVCIEPLR